MSKLKTKPAAGILHFYCQNGKKDKKPKKGSITKKNM